MLQAIDIRKKYGDNEILKGVTVRVDKGEVVAVIGRSGSGKSTLLRCLNHLETIDSGEIRIDGQAMVTTGADGTASFSVKRGSYVAQVACNGYKTQAVQLSVTGSLRERVKLS